MMKELHLLLTLVIITVKAFPSSPFFFKKKSLVFPSYIFIDFSEPIPLLQTWFSYAIHL